MAAGLGYAPEDINSRMKLGGQHVVLPEQTPLANLHLSLLNKMGIEPDAFADSTGMISEI